MKILEINCETGQQIEREATAQELAIAQADQAKAEAQEAAKTQKAAEKAALLSKLGITEDEAKLLLS
jgi:hypothetical protein